MSSSSPTRPVILLADDDVNIRETTMDLLSLTGAEVLGACSGRDASRQLEGGRVNLLITDMIMPEGDGHWLLKFVRSSPQHCHLRVIMLSARTDPEEVAAGLQAGADAYLTKPFDPEKLLETVAHWLRQPPRA